MSRKKTIENDVKKVDHMVIKQLELHANRYDSAPDKKDFLKNVCAYEQKIILLNSKNPYEVLNYMQELDLESSRLVLDELNYEEIKNLLELFTSEHKKMFYNSFSSLELVNSFITCDKKSYEYVKNLSFNRKIDLLKNSKKETIQATTELYDSMSTVEKKEAEQAISFESSAQASHTLSEVVDGSENYQTENLDELVIEKIDNAEDLLEKDEEYDENTNTKKEQELENPGLLKEKNNFLKANIQKYIEQNIKFEEVDINLEDVYSLLPSDLKLIIDNDFNLNKQMEDVENLEKYSIIGNGERYVSIVSNPMIISKFEQVKNISEKIEIENLKNRLQNSLENNEQKQM